ncbi:MAG: hypothetical protein CMQ19_03695 [Gammaproteobacteria bacterium]|nr:hypothetical protein [Gammaproteobacteria bacterium]
MVVEFWTSGRAPDPAEVAQRAEGAGFDGIIYVDSQNLASDCYIALARAAMATSHIKLGTGVTNPVTRHPATTASAIATVQSLSKGRANLGIGRGDSSLAYIGYAPAPLKTLKNYVIKLQAYLSGEEVPFDADSNVDSLGLADKPKASQLTWLPKDQAKVPVDVAATGPRAIAMAAQHADRVSLMVGADPERIAWGIEVARAARQQAGLDGDIPFAAYLPLIVHDDPERAVQLGEGSLASQARFSVMHGKVVGPVSEKQQTTLDRIHSAYDMTRHTEGSSSQAATLNMEFAQDFGIFGPPSYCIERLQALIELGVDRFFLPGGSMLVSNNEDQVRAVTRLVEEVLPRLRHGS